MTHEAYQSPRGEKAWGAPRRRSSEEKEKKEGKERKRKAKRDREKGKTAESARQAELSAGGGGGGCSALRSSLLPQFRTGFCGRPAARGPLEIE